MAKGIITNIEKRLQQSLHSSHALLTSKIKNASTKNFVLAGAVTLLTFILGLTAWMATSGPKSVKASAADSSGNSDQTSLSISTSTVTSVGQDNGGQNSSGQDPSAAGSNSATSASVDVNGQTVTSTTNGSVNKVVKTPDGNVDISIQSNNSPTSGKSGHSSQNIFVHSNSDVRLKQQSTGGSQ